MARFCLPESVWLCYELKDVLELNLHALQMGTRSNTHRPKAITSPQIIVVGAVVIFALVRHGVKNTEPLGLA